MPDPIQSTAGCKIYIGGQMDSQSALLTPSDFSGESWTLIGFAEDLGSIGDTSAPITFSAIGEDRVFKLKGSRDAGTQEIMLASKPTDAGQIALVAAEASRSNYAFRVTWPDGVSTPTTRMYIAMVMSNREEYGSSDNVIKYALTLGLNSNVVRVAAV